MPCPPASRNFSFFGHFFLGPGQGPFSAYIGRVAQKGAKGPLETLFAQSRVLGQTRAADADFDRIFAISRDAGSPAPKTCQLSAKPIGKVRAGVSTRPSSAERRLLARSARTKRFVLASLCQGNSLGAKGVRPEFSKFDTQLVGKNRQTRQK